MTFDEYDAAASRTIDPEIEYLVALLHPSKSEVDRTSFAMLLNAALGAAGEGGEIVDNVKKVIFHYRPLDDAMKEKLRKEIGDDLWYLNLGAKALGTTLGEIAQENIDKLNERHPEQGVDFGYHDKQA